MNNHPYSAKKDNPRKKPPKATYIKLKLFLAVLLSFILCLIIQYTSILAKKSESKNSTILHFNLRFSEIKVKEEYDSLLIKQQKQLNRWIDIAIAFLKKKLFKKGFYYTYQKWFLIAIDLFNVLQLVFIFTSYVADFFGIIKLLLVVYDLGNMVSFAVKHNAIRSISYFLSVICRIGYLVYSWK